MGLDITAYKNAKIIDRLPDIEDWETKYWENPDYPQTDYIGNYHADSFPEWRDGLELGAVYQYEDSYSFRAGSYYNFWLWRDWLSTAILGVSAGVVWDKTEKYQNSPFYRLINFSDREGIIGPLTAKSLATDFQEFQRAIDELGCDGWLKDKYADWRKAFEYAAENGYVDFH